MASGSLSSASSSLIHPFGASGSSTVTENTSTDSSVTPPPTGHHLTLESSVNHPLLSHHLVMKNERNHQHRLYQPYHLPLHHPHHIQHHHHFQQQQQQQQHLLESSNHYDLSQHYPVASTSSLNLIGGTESRCSSVSSSGGGTDQHHHVGLTLKSEQPQQQNSLDQTSSLELLDNANVNNIVNLF